MQLVAACHAANIEPFMEVSDVTQASPETRNSWFLIFHYLRLYSGVMQKSVYEP